MPWNAGLYAEGREHAGHEVEPSRRDAAGKHEHVVLHERRSERRGYRVHPVGKLKVRSRRKPRERERPGEAVRIRAPDLVLEDRLARFDEFVAGGEDRDARRAGNLQFRMARRCGDREFRRREPCPGLQEDVTRPCVGATTMHMAPRRRFATGLDFGVAIRRLDLLHRNDRVAAARHHRARHDLETVGLRSQVENRRAGGLGPGDPELPSIPGAARECDAVHRHAIERRRIALRPQRRAQDAAGSGRERDRLRRHRRDGCCDRRFGLGGSQHAAARVSPACRGP